MPFTPPGAEPPPAPGFLPPPQLPPLAMDPGALPPMAMPGIGMPPGPMGQMGLTPEMGGIEPPDPLMAAMESALPSERGNGLVSAEARRLVSYDLHLSEDRRKLLARVICQEIDNYERAVETRRELLKEWRRAYKLMPSDPTGRWEGSSTLRSPFSHIYTNAHANRLDSQIISHDPPFTVTAIQPDAVEVTPQIEEVLTASLEEAEWASIASRVHKEIGIAGACFLRVTYEEEWIRKPTLMARVDEEAFGMQAATGVDPTVALVQATEMRGNGLPRLSLEFVDECVKAGPSYKVIPWEYGFVLPAHVTDIKDARAIGERLTVTGIQLQQGARDGKYIKSAVDDLLDSPSDPVNWEDDERREMQGIDVYDTTPADHESPLYATYELHEMCWYGDYNGDGREELYVFTVHRPSLSLLRAQYMPYEHGRPYYHKFGFYENEDDLFGMGVPELLAVVQAADTAMLNAITDYCDLLLNRAGNYFYDPAKHDPSKFQGKMNEPIPIEDLVQGSGVVPMGVSGLPAGVFEIRANYQDMAERITNVSDPALGKETSGDKTLGELRLLTAQASQIFETQAANVARQWVPVIDQHRYLLAQFGTDGKVQFRKSAEPGLVIQGDDGNPMPAAKIGGEVVPAPGGVAFGEVESDLLRRKVDFVPTGLKQLGDWTARLQQSMMVYGILTQNTITASNPEVQLLVLDDVLQKARFPQRDKVIDLVKRQLQEAQMMQQIAQQAEMDAAMTPDVPGDGSESPMPPPGAEGGAPKPGAGAEGGPPAPEPPPTGTP